MIDVSTINITTLTKTSDLIKINIQLTHEAIKYFFAKNAKPFFLIKCKIIYNKFYLKLQCC